MSALAPTRAPLPGVAATDPGADHGEPAPGPATRRDTGPPALPEGSQARKLAELAATLRKAAQIAESLSQDAQDCLASPAGQSVMDDVPEALRSTHAEPEPAPGDSLLTVADLARLLRLDERTVRRRRRDGSIPAAIDIGGSLRWRRSEIDAWLEEQREAVA